MFHNSTGGRNLRNSGLGRGKAIQELDGLWRHIELVGFVLRTNQAQVS